MNLTIRVLTIINQLYQYRQLDYILNIKTAKLNHRNKKVRGICPISTESRPEIVKFIWTIEFRYIFTTQMQGRGDYRIRSAKRTEDDIDMEFEEQLKLSSQLQGKKKEQPPGHYRRPIDSSQNSRLKESRTGSAFGSVLGSRVGRVLRVSKNEKDKNVVTDIQFNNVRWISIVSAYDSKRLKHVTVSKQSCEQFLKKYGNGVKKDPAALACFKDIKKHFHSWLSKINETFVTVLNHFLTTTDKSPLSELEKVNPILEEIRYDTAMMKEKLEGCLKYYQNNDFRKMATKFTDFFSFSSRLELIISIIFQKKEKIDSLFFELQSGVDVDRDLQKIRKEGVKETKKLIYTDIKNTNLCDRIMQKVTHAINDMSAKGLNLFHKLQNAKTLISRIKKILNESHKRLTIKEIKKFSQIFNEVLEETSKFQEFVQEFDSESDFVTPELREKIHFCREELISKKRAVGEMQIIFVATVINETIDLLHGCHSLKTALTQKHISYQEYNHLLDTISSAMLDQTKKGITEGLVKQNRIAFSRLEEQLDKISRSLIRHEQGFIIDTEDGQVASMECAKLTKDYKDKIKSLVKKHEDALRHLNSPIRDVKLPSSDRDSELIFLNKLVGISEVINNREWHTKISHQKGFHEIKEGIVIAAGQVQKTESIFAEFDTYRSQIEKINSQNPLKDLIRIVRTENGLYQECIFLLNMHKVISKTSEKNLIQILNKVGEINLKRKQELYKQQHYKQTKAYVHMVDRLYCLILVKGLKKNVVKEIDDSKFMVFPENDYEQKQMQNEIKYRTLIVDALGVEANLTRMKLTSNINIMKDLVNGKVLIDKLKLNQNGQYIALTEVLSGFSIQMFRLCLLKENSQGKSTETRRIVLELIKCLKTKSMNMDILQGELDLQNHEAILRVRKEFIHYKNLNQNALNACEELSKAQNNNPLDTLSKATHIIAEYLHSTKQGVYLALNEWKEPVWVGTPEQAKNGLGFQINLNGYPRGSFTSQYVHEAPKIQDEKNTKLAKPLSPSKKEPSQEVIQKSSNIIIKEKSHLKDSMDEEILAIESDKQIRDEMIEDIPDLPEDQMGEEIVHDEEMEEDIGDQMGEDFEDYEEDLKEEMEENMAQQIGDNSLVKLSQPKLQPLKQQNLKPTSTKKIEEVKQLVSVYQIIPFFRELQQIKQLFSKVNDSERLFWKENIDFQQIEDFYHRPEDLKDRNNFIKSLQNCFSMFLGARFGPKLGEAVKNLDKLKSIKGVFLSLGQKNNNKIFEILNISQRNYSVLFNSRGEVMQIFSFDGDSAEFKKKRSRKCIYDYLERSFKTSFFNPENFDFEGYISTCLKAETDELVNQDGVSFHYVVKYRAKCDQSLPQTNTDRDLKQIKEIQTKFTQKLQTGINLNLTCLQLWSKAIDGNAEDCYKPDYSVLDRYLKDLSKIQHKESISHYLNKFREETLTLKAAIKHYKNTIDNLVFKVDSSNILECVNILAGLYKNYPTSGLLMKKGEQIVTIFLSKEEKEGILNETPLSLLISYLFEKLISISKSQAITKENVINEIQKIYSEGKANDEELTHFMQFLSILEIQHFFIKKPKFLFKKNIQQLVLCTVQEFGAASIHQMDYDELYKDIFTVTKSFFSTELTIKKNIDHKCFSKEFVNQSKQTLEKIQKQLMASVQNFKKMMKTIDMSTLLSDFLKGKAQENDLLKLIFTHSNQINEIKEMLDLKVSNKQENLLIYIHSFKASVEKLASLIDDKIKDIKSMKESCQVLKPKTKELDSLDRLFSEIKVWAKNVGLSKELTSYIMTSQEKNYSINIEFSQSLDERLKSKEYLEKLLKTNWISEGDFSNAWNFIFGKYIDKQIKIEIGAGGSSCIYYNLEASLKKIMEDIHLDLAESDDVIEFVKNYNIYRFCHSNQALEVLNKCQTRIIERLSLKRQFLQVKGIISNCDFEGLKDRQQVSSLLSCIREELQLKEDIIDDIISQTSSLKAKDSSLKDLATWYSKLCHDQLNLNSFEVRSSSGVPISLLPVGKIEKDKTKNIEIISNLLKDIKINSEFHLKLQGKTQVVQLSPETVKIMIRDSEKFLQSDKQLNAFEPELAEGEMLLLMIQQDDQESVPLWISKLQLSTEVQIIISENRSIAALSCGIWRIGKEDYEQIKDQHNVQNEKKALHKKLRGLASPEEKIKDVKIGQQIFFDSVGEWLKNQIRKHQDRVQEKQRAEKQKIRLLELQRKEESNFLDQIEEKLQKEHVLRLPLKLEQIMEKKDQLENQPVKDIEGYFKNIWSKTMKIIEKLQENKSLEEVSRLDSLTKTYLKLLETKLSENYQLELNIRDKAELKFAVILKTRQEQKQKKKKEKIKRQAEQKAKKNALNLHENIEGNALNIPVSTSGPLPEAPKQNQYEEIISSQEQVKEIDIIQLLLERKEINNDALQSFLMEWLETQQPRDADFYRCLLEEFCSLDEAHVHSMAQLK